MKPPATGELADASTIAVQKTEFERVSGVIRQMPGGDAQGSYVLDASDTIKPIVSLFAVDTFASASADSLSRITGEDGVSAAGLPDGSIVILHTVSSSRVVTVTHGIGGSWQILLVGAANFVMNSPFKRLALERRATSWYEIGRSFGADVAAERTFLGLTQAATLANPANPGDNGKAVLASAGVLTIGTPVSTGGPAHRLLVSRNTNQTVGLANGSTWSQANFNSIAVETSAGNLWDAGTFEIKIPAGIAYVRVTLNLSIGFSTPPAVGWWVEGFSFRKVSAGSYPASPDSHTLAGLLSTTLQSAGGVTDGYLNAQSGEIAVATGDRLKAMLRGFAAGAGNNMVIRGGTVPAACSLSVEFFA